MQRFFASLQDDTTEISSVIWDSDKCGLPLANKWRKLTRSAVINSHCMAVALGAAVISAAGTIMRHVEEVALGIVVAIFAFTAYYVRQRLIGKPPPRRVLIVVAVIIGLTVVALAAAGYSYFYTEHVIFSSMGDGLSFRAYCQYRGFRFTTYVEVSGADQSGIILLHEVPPSTDDLSDCRMRFPIQDIEPDFTYSYLTISFHATDATPALFNGVNQRPPLVIPMALQGLDLPNPVRERVNQSRSDFH